MGGGPGGRVVHCWMPSDGNHYKARVKKPIKLESAIVECCDDRIRFGTMEPAGTKGLDRWTDVPAWKYEIPFSEIRTVRSRAAGSAIEGTLRDGTELYFRLLTHQGSYKKSWKLAFLVDEWVEKIRTAAIEGGSSFRPVGDED